MSLDELKKKEKERARFETILSNIKKDLKEIENSNEKKSEELKLYSRKT